MHNLEIAGDLRVRRTRKLLQDALIELTLEKGFAAVTVRDITQRAMVNRSTFYRHYLDKYALLDQYMDEAYTLVEQMDASDGNQEQAAGKAPPGLVNLLKHIQESAGFYRIMLGEPAFVRRFRQNHEKRFRYLLSKKGVEIDPDGPSVDLRLSYTSYASIGAIVWWLENNQPCSTEQLALWLSELSTPAAGLDQ